MKLPHGTGMPSVCGGARARAAAHGLWSSRSDFQQPVSVCSRPSRPQLSKCLVCHTLHKKKRLLFECQEQKRKGHKLPGLLPASCLAPGSQKETFTAWVFFSFPPCGVILVAPRTWLALTGERIVDFSACSDFML